LYRPVIIVKTAAKEDHQELHGDHKTQAQETREHRDMTPPSPENVIAIKVLLSVSVLVVFVFAMTVDAGPWLGNHCGG
jgi:hypothetical protein